MKNNPHLGSDALAFIQGIVPDTPETRRVEQQELFRLALTQAMREIRKQAGLIPFLFEDAPYKTDAKLHTVAAIHELPLRE